MQASDVYHFVLCGINSSIQVFKCAFVMYSIKETHGLMECRLIMGFYHSTFSDSSKMDNAFVAIIFKSAKLAARIPKISIVIEIVLNEG